MKPSINMKGITLAAGTPLSLPFDKNRAYLSVRATASTSVTFTDSGVSFVLDVGEVSAPIPSPLNALTIAGAGTVITG